MDKVENEENQSAGSLKPAIAAAGLGSFAGGSASAATYYGAAALGSSSTGVPISQLGGAAASRATLALLGGGSIASGGRGVKGGKKLLAAVGILVAGIVAYKLYSYFSRKRENKPNEPG